MTSTMLIDGNSLTYRAFFALPTDLATASGQVTNAVFGFTSMLVNLLRDHRPDRVVVAFDRPEPTYRHELVGTYKANRAETPDLLREQMGLVREVIEVLAIPAVELAGYEADDLLATLAEQAASAGDEVIVVTGDRDCYQLVRDPQIRVLYNKRGVSDYVLYDEAGIEDRTGVRPGDYVTYAALRGDPSDNLPGVPGVGEKTAARLVNGYGSLDGIFEHLDDQTPKLRENLAANEERVRLNAELMQLDRAAPLDVEVTALALQDPDADAVRQLFDFLEFQTIYERLVDALDGRLEPSAETQDATLEIEFDFVDDASQAPGVVDAVSAHDGVISMQSTWSGRPGRSPLRRLALGRLDAGSVVPRVHVLAGELVDDDSVRASLAALCGRSEGIVGHGTKELMRSLLAHGVDITSLKMDTLVAAYLLDPGGGTFPLGELLARHTSLRLADRDSATEGQLDLVDDPADQDHRVADEAGAVLLLAEALDGVLGDRGLRELHDDVETPLVRVLARMEVLGVGVDSEELAALHDRLRASVDELRRLIWADAGEEFNVNSTPQLRTVLFENLGLTPQKKTKTGYSTDATSLERLVGQHPIVEHLLRYREAEKLRSTYGEGLLAEVGTDGRIHATFNQTVARTGRLSSDAPNLHNIPVRTEIGREFRRCFVPAPGFELLVADYNQIELRCIAHLARDPGLVEAFEHHTDIHTQTAARIFDVDPDDVSASQRARAKMVSYGLAYGMEAYGLAQRLRIETGEAQTILDAYFEAFPAVASYMDEVVAQARTRGYTETLFGRRRQIPELSSSNFRIRQAGERQAKNAGIQGLAADIFKVALVRLDRALSADRRESRLVLQVHDEVVLELAGPEREDVTRTVVDTMAGAFELIVPLEVNLAIGSNWAEAKA